MKRNINLNDISDGKLYTAQDMVRTDCRDCVGCSACCRGMGESIILDPMDLYRLALGTGMDFAGLMRRYIELRLVDGLILPNLKMDGEKEACPFLDEKGRCSIHAHRPGICRMFPLGRYYEENGFRYFLQVKECRKTDRTKIKVKKWLGIPDLRSYEKYIWDWHIFLEQCREGLKNLDEQNARILCLYIIKTFYEKLYVTDSQKAADSDFYEEFYGRLLKAKEDLGFCY